MRAHTVGQMLEDQTLVGGKAHRIIWNGVHGYKICKAQTKPSRRLRFPFGRRGASVLGWIATSAQCRHELTEERATASSVRYGREEVSRTDQTRARWVPGLPYLRAKTDAVLAVNRWASIRKNPRQGWDKYGEALALAP